MENLSLELKNIEMNFGNKELLAADYLAVYQNDRIGIVGRNGQGKTTLLNLIQGNVAPNSGKVNRLVDFNYFKQIEEMSDLFTNEDLDVALLNRLSIPINTSECLSGGEETKIRLARALSDYKMGLLMDEPTTHLDGESIRFLIEELKYYYGTLILVSHDRYFLDQLVTKIWEIEEGSINEYPGNYSDYIVQKEQKRVEKAKIAEKANKEKQRLEQAIEQKRKQAKKMSTISEKNKNKHIKPDRLSSSKQKDSVQKAVQKSAKALETRVTQLGEVEKVATLKPIRFPMRQALEMHNRFPIMGQTVTLYAGEKLLLDRVDFQFSLGKKIAITGDNGTGKSSLLQHILNGGEGVTVSQKVRVSFYKQMDYKLKDTTPIIDYLMKQTDYPENTVRSVLDHLGFRQTELSKPVCALSGGEATRISLAVVFIRPSNVIVLDEPTNFIDIQTIEALESFIKHYPGTVVFTSHDQYFVEKTADQIWKVTDQTLSLVKGDVYS
ncbi:ribosomal protection-like ABC-F family protein [Carnobacterium mobile]|uniref:ribosomal protection-like ABC-F family protein n=1 Tax=Carnobacterium mobile TaxID=2750 RepID=UPI0005501697|nr:ABC-F type ribosomal protection protein [Carnobacterium mobile]